MSLYNKSFSSLIALIIIMGPGSIIAVGLRIVARRRSNFCMGSDDVLAVVALCGFLTFLGFILWESENGLDTAFLELPSEVLKNNLKALWFSKTFAPLPAGMSRFSLLCLYNRIFKTDRSFYVAVRIVGVLNGLWYVTCTVTLALRCFPMKKIWDRLLEGQCYHNISVFVVISISDSLLDFMVMGLPISILRKLQMSLRRKIHLAVIFAIGSFVGFIGFLRVAIAYNALHAENYVIELWLCIQLGFAVICCCLPIYGSILPKEGNFALARNLCSQIIDKIIIPFTSRSYFKHEPEPRTTSGLKPQLREPGNPSDAEADGISLEHKEGYFELGDRHAARSNFSLDTISTKGTAEIV